MPLASALLNRKVRFQRRAPVPSTPGADRPGFSTFGVEVYGAYKDGHMQSLDVGGFDVKVPSGILTLRDSAFARGLSGSEQVLIGDVPFQVLGPALPERPTGALRFGVQGIATRAAFAQVFDMSGETVTVRRVQRSGPNIDVVARAVIMGFTPEELVGGINQAERKIYVSAEDLEKAGFPEPIVTNDRIIMRGGKSLNVIAVDASTLRIAGELRAYLIRAMG